MTITEQLVKALRIIADIKRTQLQEGNCGQDPTYEGYWSVLNRARSIARTALAAYEASKAAPTPLDYIFQTNGNANNGVRIVDLCYTAFMRAKACNNEDGGSTDWFTDTYPDIVAGIELMRPLIAQTATPAQGQDIEGLVEVLRFYANEWRGNMEGDGSTPGLSRCWEEPTEALWRDAGSKARAALLAVQQKLRGGE